MLLSVAGFLGSVGATIGVRIVPVFVQFQKFEVIVIIWLAGEACADVIITTALVLHLVSAVFDLHLPGDTTSFAEESKEWIPSHRRCHRSCH